MIANLETAYNRVAEKYSREKLQPPIQAKDILALAEKAVLVPSAVVTFIKQVLEEAEKVSKS